MVGKNYRLQDIQLSKITPGDIAPGNLREPRGDSPGPLRSLTRGPKPHSVRSRISLKLPATNFQADGAALARWLLSEIHFLGRLALTAKVGLPTVARSARVPRAKIGEYRARTGDLLVANQALSQLS